MINVMEMGMSATQMEIDMRDSLKKVRLTVKEYITGTLEKFLMVNGNMVLRKEMGFGKELMEIHTLENG